MHVRCMHARCMSNACLMHTRCIPDAFPMRARCMTNADQDQRMANVRRMHDQCMHSRCMHSQCIYSRCIPGVCMPDAWPNAAQNCPKQLKIARCITFPEFARRNRCFFEAASSGMHRVTPMHHRQCDSPPPEILVGHPLRIHLRKTTADCNSALSGQPWALASILPVRAHTIRLFNQIGSV